MTVGENSILLADTNLSIMALKFFAKEREKVIFSWQAPFPGMLWSGFCFSAVWVWLKFYFQMEKFVVYYNTTNFLKNFAGGGEKRGVCFWTVW